MDHVRPPVSTKLGKMLNKVYNSCGRLYSNAISLPDALSYSF
jgi:hypothetical protein